MLNKINTYLYVVIFLYGFCVTVVCSAAERKSNLIPPKPKKMTQIWQLKPEIPAGWQEIDRKEAKITNKKDYDVFVLMTDGKNDLIVWFEKIGHYWKMSIIESVPSEDHIKYGVNIKEVKIFIRGSRILYGPEGSEAISYYDWNENEKIFIQYVPFVE